MKTPFLSVLSPVYNGAAHLDDLLNCLKNQTCKNFEVIIIDDCSTDNSYEIVHNFINNLPEEDRVRYRLYRTVKNLGSGHFHLKYVYDYLHGEYFYCLTQDDYIDTNFVELCYNKSLENDYDIILTNLCFLKNNEATYLGREYLLDFTKGKLTNRDLFELSLTWKVSVCACRKTKLLKEAGFFNDTYYNIDEYICRKLFLMTDKIAFVDTNYYYRIDNPDALTKKLKPFTFDILTTFALLIDAMIEYKFDKESIRIQISNLIDSHKHFCYQFYSSADQFSNAEKKHILSILENVNRKIRIYFPYFNAMLYIKYYRIKYKMKFLKKFIYNFKAPN